MKQWFVTHRWIVATIVVAFILRLFWITNQPLDWHAFRQADTASVTREFVLNGIDLLHPHYHDLANIQSGKDNLAGWRMVEFPWVNGLTAALILVTRGNEIVIGRLVNVLFSLLAIGSVYWLVKRVSDERLALVSATVMSVLPYSVFYSRALLPEAAMLGTSMVSLVAFDIWLEQRSWKWYITSLIALSLALLLKPFVLFFGGVYLALIWYRRGWKGFFAWQNFVYAGLAILPLWWWRQWIEQFPSGIPANDWLWNSNGIRWRPAWFRWLFWERLTLLIGGVVGAILGALNIIKWKEKSVMIWFLWWVGILAYFSAIATGNVQHDYYQTLVIPIISITIARGAVVLFDFLKKRLTNTHASLVVGGVLAVMVVIAWQQVKGYYNINHREYIEAGYAVDQLVPADAQVIAPAFGDTQFLFQTKRRGWPIGFEIEDKIAKGATHYVTTSYDDEARMLEQQYQTLAKTPMYLILDLTTPVATSSTQP